MAPGAVSNQERGQKVNMNSPFADIQSAIGEFRAGRMVIIVDDEDRENEGDLAIAAEAITPEAVNFMARFGRGLICLAMTPERLDYLELPPMSAHNTARFGTAFTEPIDAVGRGVTTGISARDRAETILCAIDPKALPSDLARPGHVFPLRAQKGGVLVRSGQTEASVDLARLAGLTPAGVICEIMNHDGTMARVPDLVKFSAEHGLKMITVAELIRYRMAHESCVHRQASAVLSTEFGPFSMIAYASDFDAASHIALVHGDIESTGAPVLVRMHTHCLAGDIFHSASCNCAATLRSSMRRIVDEGAGALIYLHQNALGFTIREDDSAPMLEFHRDGERLSLQESERRIQRQVGTGAQILRDLKLRRIRVITDHPRRIAALSGFGIEVVGFAPATPLKAGAFDWPDAELLSEHAHLSALCGGSAVL